MAGREAQYKKYQTEIDSLKKQVNSEKEKFKKDLKALKDKHAKENEEQKALITDLQQKFQAQLDSHTELVNKLKESEQNKSKSKSKSRSRADHGKSPASGRGGRSRSVDSTASNQSTRRSRSHSKSRSRSRSSSQGSRGSSHRGSSPEGHDRSTSRSPERTPSPTPDEKAKKAKKEAKKQARKKKFDQIQHDIAKLQSEWQNYQAGSSSESEQSDNEVIINSKPKKKKRADSESPSRQRRDDRGSSRRRSQSKRQRSEGRPSRSRSRSPKRPRRDEVDSHDSRRHRSDRRRSPARSRSNSPRRHRRDDQTSDPRFPDANEYKVTFRNKSASRRDERNRERNGPLVHCGSSASTSQKVHVPGASQAELEAQIKQFVTDEDLKKFDFHVTPKGSSDVLDFSSKPHVPVKARDVTNSNRMAPGRDYLAAGRYVSNIISDIQNSGNKGSRSLSDRFAPTGSSAFDCNHHPDRQIIDLSGDDNIVTVSSHSRKSGARDHENSRQLPYMEAGGVATDHQGPNMAPCDKPPFDLSALQLQVHSGVGDYLDVSIIKKIFNKEFIDLATLLPPDISQLDKKQSGRFNWDPKTKHLTQEEDDPKTLGTFNMWSKAFEIFMEVHLMRYPEEAAQLLRYVRLVRDAAYMHARSKIQHWRLYDTEFRKKLARYPTIRWDTTDQYLWNRLVILQLAGASGSSTNDNRSKKGGASFKSKNPCKEFNSEAGCSRAKCRFTHICDYCKKPRHTSLVCNKRKKDDEKKKGEKKSSKENSDH